MQTHRYRTHTCGELRAENVGEIAKLSGWIHTIRNHGGIIFVDLRDHYGLTQLVLNPDQAFFEQASRLPRESVILVSGPVMKREAETVNPTLNTGEVELWVDAFEVLGQADLLPFSIADERPMAEATRLTYRFLDLRRQSLHDHVMLRSRVIASIRRRMTDMGFNEFQTPILTSSSPEGARDFLVPSRLHPGKFYALPQAPQQFKQLLMIAGFDRYFQIAPCFRDEDARADRSPGEFYQLDLEMSFVEQDDVFAVVEQVFTGIFSEFSDWSATPAPYPRLTYADAMLRYGSDKPDLRFGLEIQDVSSIFIDSDFRIFQRVVEGGGVVRVLYVPNVADRPRSFFDSLDPFIKQEGGKGLAYLVLESDGGVRGPIASVLDEALIQKLKQETGAREGGGLFFIADTEKVAATLAGRLRLHFADELDLRTPHAYRFCWIVDYPMYEWDENDKRIRFSHNPFSMPQDELQALETQPPLEILAYQYDLVCNGIELSSGAIRNHRLDVMYKAFELAGYSRDEVDQEFGGMIRALKFGAPPHGGIAPGIDRIVMLLADVSNIREVVAFPMNQNAQDLLMEAPNHVTQQQLDELHIRLHLPKK